MNIPFKFYKSVLIALSFFASINAKEKVLIFTHSYCRPDFIELQAKTFKAFMQDEYEFVVFNDASKADIQQQINQTCANLGIRCIRIPQHIHTNQAPGWRHIDCIKYSFDTLGFNFDGMVVMIDSDAFLIKPFSVNNYLHGYDLIGNAQKRANDHIQVTYVSPVIVFINMKTAPNKMTISFYGGYIEGMACDVGAHMYYYIKNNPTLRYRLFDNQNICNMPNDSEQLQASGFDERAINFIMTTDPRYMFEFHAEHNFLHYYAGGSNWPGHPGSFLQAKDELLHKYIHGQIDYYNNLAIS